jgi:oligopeptide/dipeptide ABC transporter ATP-binding protein
LFITHNLRVLDGLAGRVLVMYAGLVVEEIAGDFTAPLHPYTMGLLRALPPKPTAGPPARLTPIPGRPPGPTERPEGCAFAPRCPEARPSCGAAIAPLKTLPDGRRVRCRLY